jgi:uncharacterized protein (DUF934 family)
MPQIIKGCELVDDDWQVIPKPESDKPVELPEGKIIVPLAVWLAQRDTLLARTNETGVWLDSDEPPEALADDIARLPVIAINFPVFSDGRGYSYARALRQFHNFEGELRAIGDVLRDQLFFMKRCGFTSFQLREDRSKEDALTSFSDFSEVYQGAVEQPEPLFRRR